MSWASSGGIVAIQTQEGKVASRETQGGIVILVLLALGLTVGSLKWPGPGTPRVDQQLLAPGGEQLFGTDELGRDILAGTVHATVFSTGLALLVALLATVFGGGMGLAGGLAGSFWQRWILTVTDSLLAFPGLLLAIALAVFVGPGPGGMVLALALPAAAASCRVLAADTGRYRGSEFLAVARAAGASRWWLLSRHLTVLVRPLLVVRATQLIPQVILAEATLTFLGLGISPEQCSLGQMIEVGRHHLGDNPWMMVLPGFSLVTLTLGLGLIAEGVRRQASRR